MILVEIFLSGWYVNYTGVKEVRALGRKGLRVANRWKFSFYVDICEWAEVEGIV